MIVASPPRSLQVERCEQIDWRRVGLFTAFGAVCPPGAPPLSIQFGANIISELRAGVEH